MNRLRLIPLDDAVVLPGMSITLAADADKDERVFLVPKHDNTYANVGVIAEVADTVRIAGRGMAVSLTALERGIPGKAVEDLDGVLRVDVEARPDTAPPRAATDDLEREYR